MTNETNDGAAVDTGGAGFRSAPTAIEGSANVLAAPIPLPVGKAIWEVNAEAKNATTSFLGGVGTIIRRDDTGKFEGTFVIPTAEEGAEDGSVDLLIPLHDCANLVEAQAHFEGRVRESLSKTHADLHAELTAGEHQDAVAAAGPDPF